MKTLLSIITILGCLFSTVSFAETVDDYLLLQDIGRYKVDKPRKFWDEIIGGPTSDKFGNEAEGYLAWSRVSYAGGEGYAAPGVIVSVYGSTQWMLHEFEGFHKRHEDGVATTTDTAVGQINLNNNVIIVYSISGNRYSWISNDKIITVKYHDSHFEYPEPTEVVTAYLLKYPSTLPATYRIRKAVKNEIWIKEEFDRLLWISERWVSLIQEADPKQAEKLTNAAENLEDFAQYRKVYFEDDMDKDIEFLQTSHMRPGQDEFVRAKLAEYQDWWASHKDDSISFP